MAQEFSLDEIEQKLAYLGKASVRIARAGMLAGAKVVARHQQVAGQAALSSSRPKSGRVVRTGRMLRSLNSRTIRGTSQGVGAKAGFDVGKHDKNADPSTGARGHHGHLFVGGTVRRETGSVRVRIGRKVVGRKATGGPVQNRGVMPSHLPSFIAAGALAAKGEATAAIHTSLVAGIGRAIDRLGG